jgi:hypothetical protein
MAAILLFGKAARANTPALEWDPNPEPTVVGYNVYCGTRSGTYTIVVDVGPQTQLPLTNLIAAVTYYFAVTAYDADRLESPFSDEVWFTPRVDGMNAAQLPFTLSIEMNAPVLRFSARAGQHCWIVGSPDLQRWEQVYDVNVADDRIIEFTETNAQQPQHFYRVIGTP